MELRHLRYFLAVAEERHFGRAAKRLRIAQPPLSRQIHALEAEVGLPLFDRAKRRIELTPAGTAFLTHARRVFEVIDDGVHEARRAAAGQIGRIAVGYPTSVAFGGLVDLLGAFRAHSPGVEVTLRELAPQDQVDALKDGRIDVGFVRTPIDGDGLASCRVYREPLLIVLPEGHPLAGHRRIALSLLAREPFVCFPRSRSPTFFDFLMRLCHDAGFTPRIAQEAPLLDILSLVAAGFGVAMLPGSVRAAGRPGVVFRPIQGAPETELRVAWRPNDPSPVLRDFLQVVREVGVGRARAEAQERGQKREKSAPPSLPRGAVEGERAQRRSPAGA
jgi:DNA-binding transcriptional LysR family regulator